MKTDSRKERCHCNVRIGCVVAVLVSAIIAGCINTVPPEPVVPVCSPPDTPVSGAPEKPVTYDLERLVKMMMDKMTANSGFTDDYNAVKLKKGKNPHLVVALVDNESEDAAIRSRREAMRDSMNERLSSLFRLKNDKNSLALANSIFIEVAAGDADVNKEITDGSLDFYVRSRVYQFPEDVGVYHYRFQVTLYNLHTGDVVWEGTQRFYKSKTN